MPSRTYSRLLRSTLLAAATGWALAAPATAAIQSASDPVLRFQTSVGNIDVELFPGDAPKTVANFLHYVDKGTYAHTFFHRSVANFVIQGGGYEYVNGAVDQMPTDGYIPNEHQMPDSRGTLAMAQDSHGATDQWFFNVVDNFDLDKPTQTGGGFTVFGRVIDKQSLGVVDAINRLPVHDADALYTGSYDPAHPPLATVPLANWTPGSAVDYRRDLVSVAICRLAPTDTCDPAPPPYAPAFVPPPYTDGSPPAPAPPDDTAAGPTPAPRPAPAPPPVPRIGRVTVSLARRTVSLALRCPSSGLCRGTVTLAAGHTTLGRAAYAGRRLAAITAVVHLTPAGRRLLTHSHHPLAATVTITETLTGTGPGAPPVTAKVTVPRP